MYGFIFWNRRRQRGPCRADVVLQLRAAQLIDAASCRFRYYSASNAYLFTSCSIDHPSCRCPRGCGVLTLFSFRSAADTV